MFPAISISVAGLEPTQLYTIAIDFLPGQHKYKYDGSKWNIARPAEPHPPQRWHVHPDSPQLGEDWEKKWGITFHKLKITHNIDRLHHDGYVRGYREGWECGYWEGWECGYWEARGGYAFLFSPIAPPIVPPIAPPIAL